MNYGPPQPPGHFPPAAAAGGYYDLAIAFGILFAIFFTLCCGLVALLLYLAFKRSAGSHGSAPPPPRSSGANYGT